MPAVPIDDDDFFFLVYIFLLYPSGNIFAFAFPSMIARACILSDFLGPRYIQGRA